MAVGIVDTWDHGSALGVDHAGTLTGKGEDTGMDHPEHKSAMGEFTRWFEEEMMVNYGGIDCRDITKGNPANRVELCPGIIADTYAKCMEILEEKGLI